MNAMLHIFRHRRIRRNEKNIFYHFNTAFTLAVFTIFNHHRTHERTVLRDFRSFFSKHLVISDYATYTLVYAKNISDILVTQFDL